jgi:hypothetical protein
LSDDLRPMKRDIADRIARQADVADQYASDSGMQVSSLWHIQNSHFRDLANEMKSLASRESPKNASYPDLEFVVAARAIHDLKTWPAMFEAIWRGDKPFEVRRDDRRFEIGDVLHLREFDPYPGAEQDGRYTGREMFVEVTFKLPGGHFGVDADHCVLGIRPCEDPSIA